jgi:phage tail sheath protein FI
MARTIVRRQAQRAVPGIPTDTGQTFMVGFTEWGPANTATQVTDPADFEDQFGGGDGVYATLHSAVELAFGEGAGTVYVSRAVGPTPVVATLTLQAAGAVDALRVDAVSPGAWGNDISVAVTNVADGEFDLEVSYLDVLVETFADNATTAALAAALATSDYVRGTVLNAADLVAVADTNLTLGDDDNGNATDTEWEAALDAFSAELGPGQILAPGRTTTAAHQLLLDHAAAHNRTALLDAAEGASKATLLALAAATGAVVNAEYGGLFPTWVTIPQRTAGVDREVPGSAFVAGLIARSDAVYDAGVWPVGTKGSNRSAPGNGLAAYALSATAEFSEADRLDLEAEGVNITIDDPAGLRLYNFRSISTDPLWSNLAQQRLFMGVQAEAQRIAEGFVGERIIPATVTRFHQALEGYLYSLYQSGALFGGLTDPTWDQALRVVTAAPVNTDATAADRELNAELYIRPSENAELVVIVATKVPVSSPVAA